MKALIIIDVQNDFLDGGVLAVPGGNQVIPVINSISAYFQLVVATQDWHPPGHSSFASSHQGKKPLDIITNEGLEQVLWPDHCVQGRVGANFADLLNLNRAEAIFRKGVDKSIDSYSGFFDNGRKKATGLADYLSGRGVVEVYLVGLAGDYCVGYTALDALSLGFATFVIEDATRPISHEGWDTMKQAIYIKGGKIISSGEI